MCKKREPKILLGTFLEKKGKHDAETKQIPCDYCKKMFPANKLKQHKSRYHRPKIFLCDICRK